MSDCGLRIRDAQGSVTLNITDSITRFMWQSAHTNLPGNSGALSQIDGVLTAEFAVPVNADINKTAHLVSRSGNIISWTVYNPVPMVTAANCVIFCFGYS